MSLRTALLATLVSALWGLNVAAIKLGAREFPPLFLLVLRFVLVAAIMLPFVKRPDRRTLGPVLAVSVLLGGLNFGFTFLGVTRLEAATAAIVGQLSVPFSVVLAAIFFGERLGARRLVGIALALAGVAILVGAPRVANDALGLAYIIIGALAWAAANILIKRHGPFDPFMLTAWMSLFAAPQLLAVSLLVEHGQWESLAHSDWTGWAALAYMAIGASIVAYGLWYALINRNPVGSLMPFMLLSPVFAAAGGVALGEPLTPLLVIGGAVTVIGVGICEMRFQRLRWSRRRAPDVTIAPQ